MSGQHFLYARVEPTDVRADDYAAVAEWLASYGFDAKDCHKGFVITQASDKNYYLHVSLFARADGERPVVDYVTGIPASSPRVVNLGPEMPLHPWIKEAWRIQAARKHSAPTFQRQEDGTVLVLEAPKETRASIEFIQASSPGLLPIDGNKLRMGKMPDGQEVVYRITGWDVDDNVLTLRRSEPEDDPAPYVPEPAEKTVDGLKQLADANALAGQRPYFDSDLDGKTYLCSACMSVTSVRMDGCCRFCGASL